MAPPGSWYMSLPSVKTSTHRSMSSLQVALTSLSTNMCLAWPQGSGQEYEPVQGLHICTGCCNTPEEADSKRIREGMQFWAMPQHSSSAFLQRYLNAPETRNRDSIPQQMSCWNVISSNKITASCGWGISFPPHSFSLVRNVASNY